MCLERHADLGGVNVEQCGLACLLEFLQKVQQYQFVCCSLPSNHSGLLSIGRFGLSTKNSSVMSKISTMDWFLGLILEMFSVIMAACLVSVLVKCDEGQWMINIAHFFHQFGPFLALIQFIVYKYYFLIPCELN